VVLEGLVAVNEDHGHFVGEAAAQFVVRIHVNFAPGKAAAAVQFGKGFFHNFAQVTAFAGVNDDLARLFHAGILSFQPLDFLASLGTIACMPKVCGKPLQGKAALVTGAARRLGRATALALAGAGADVVITFRHSSREAQHTVIDLSSLGVRALALQCDVTSEKSVKAAIKEAVKELGGLDLVVNNAANYETAEFEKLTLAQWDAIFASNTRGPFLVSREAAKHLRVRQGKVVNMGSLGGLRPWADHAHYCSSKAALHMLTKVMAKALAPEIAVNCVAPGMIDLGEKAAAKFMQRMAKQTPMQRNGTGEEVAAAVLFFATAPHFITGQVLAVDGGLGL